MVKFKKNKTIFILCECGSEVLVLEHDTEYDLMELSIFENLSSYAHKVSFWQRLRYIYRVLVFGRPYYDQIVLNKEQVKELRKFLTNMEQ